MSFKHFAGILLITNTVLILVMMSAFLWFSARLSENSGVMFDAAEKIASAHKIESGILSYSRESLMFEATGDEQHLIARAHARDQVVRMLERVLLHATGAEGRRALSFMSQDIQSYFSEREAMERAGTDQKVILQQLSPKVDEIVGQVDALVQQGEFAASLGVGSVADENVKADWVVLAATLIILCCLTIYFVGIWRYVLKPLLAINRSIEYFREGLIREPPAGGLKEIRLMSETVSRMMQETSRNRKSLMRNIAAVAHDIRNPLGAILTAVETASDPSETDLREFMAIIGRQAQYLDQIVRDLMDATRLETGDLSFRMASCDLKQVVEESRRLFEHHSPHHRIHLQDTGDDTHCMADGVRVSQIVNNLISNAIKYSPEGGDIELKVSASTDTVELSVADHGIGIAQEDLNGIFVPFQRSRGSAERFPGVGLGLATSRKIAEAHRGRLTVRSAVGKGSTFCLSLPRNQEDLVRQL